MSHESIATIAIVYGVSMTPNGWRWAGFIWGYAIVWFLISDRVKLAAYPIVESEHVPFSSSFGTP